MEDVAKMEYPGVDPDTVRYFKDVYLPSSIDIFEAMGQTPEDIAKVRNRFIPKLSQVSRMNVVLLWSLTGTNIHLAHIAMKTFICSLSLQCIKKVIESSSPRFRNLTNSLYTPIVALKYADETGGLSVNTFYNLLFNFGPLMHITMSILKCLTCSCLRRRTISPNWRGWPNLPLSLPVCWPPNQFLLPFPEVLGKAGRVQPVTAERVQRHYRDKLCGTACTVAQVVCLQNVLMCSHIHTVKQTQKYKQHTRWIIVHTIKRRPWVSQCLMGGTEQWLGCLYYFKHTDRAWDIRAL